MGYVLDRRSLLAVVSLLLLAGCGSSDAEGQDLAAVQESRPTYLDQDRPGLTPEQFAPHIFVRELHASLVFSEDGNSVYWSEMNGNQIRFMQRQSDGWSTPQIVPFALAGGTSEPMLAPDGQTLFFLSSQPLDDDQGENVWRVTRTADGWSEPAPLGPEVNDSPLHWSVSVSADGTLYFGRMGEEPGIYRSELRDGFYQQAVPLGPGVNTEAYETTPFIASDESYLLFSRVTESGMADLFVSFPGSGDTWLEAISLGDVVNTVPNHELCPVVSPDGEFLFFLRNVEGDLMPHWVRSSVFLDLRPD